MSENINDQLVLIAGSSATGKSASLRDLANPEGVMYLGTEAGKRLPFKSKFKSLKVTDPHQVLQAFDQANAMDDVHTIIIDSLTFLMDMYESMYVLPSANTMKAWGDYAQFFKNMMQQKVASSTKTVIFTAHNKEELDEGIGAMAPQPPQAGSELPLPRRSHPLPGPGAGRRRGRQQEEEGVRQRPGAGGGQEGAGEGRKDR